LEFVVVLDSESIYTKMLTTIAARYNKIFTMDVKVKQMGRNHRDSAQVFIGSECFLELLYLLWYCFQRVSNVPSFTYLPKILLWK